VFDVQEEKSAKDIAIDVSKDQLKLSSSNYEFQMSFAGYTVDENVVQAKFSKKTGKLSLTLTKAWRYNIN